METQKTFLRKAGQSEIKFKPVSIKEGQTKYVELLSDKVATIFVKSKGEEIPCISVKDLETNETNVLWLSGRLLSSMKALQTLGTLKGRKFEITRKGTESVELDGDTWDMNNYELYELQ